MLKYILLIQLFISGLFAHSGDGNHLHIFNSWHLGNYVLVLVSVVAGFGLFNYFMKERS